MKLAERQSLSAQQTPLPLAKEGTQRISPAA